MDYATIDFPKYTTIGGLNPAKTGTNTNGQTWEEADAIECNGTAGTPPDTGYGDIQWGPSGEVELEYNLGSPAARQDVTYKIFAKQGYMGTFEMWDAASNDYVIWIGGITKNGVAFPIDWTSVATATPAITELSNVAGYWLGHTWTDADCVTAAHCTITADDGNGHSVFTLTPDLKVGMQFVSPQGTTNVSEIAAIWNAGK